MSKRRGPSERRHRKERNRLAKRGCLNNKPRWMSWQIFHPIYAACPKGMNVDHIVPLNGDNVSGLHVPWNLQYLSEEENFKKGNKYGTF